MAISLIYAGQSTGGAYTTESGSATFTLAGGETLVIACAGLKTSDIGPPTCTAGTVVKQTAAYNAFTGSGESHGGFYTVENAASGSQSVTPPTISGGEDGLIRVWKCTGMPATLNVRTAGKTAQVSASNTITVTTSGSASVGDYAFGIRFHENTAGSTDVITQPSGWTSDVQYLNGAVNLPTDASHLIVTSAGVINATWTDIDPAINDTEAAVLVLVPLAIAATTNTQPPANIRHSEGGKRRNWDVSGWFNTRSSKNDWFWRGWPVTSGSSPDVTVALTGQSFSTAQGALGRATDKALSGQSTAFAQGTIVPNISKALSGQSASFSQGTVSPTSDKALSGQPIATGQGTAVPNIDKALTGQSAAFSQGTVTYNVSADVTVALTGQSIGTAQGTLTPTTDKGLSGQSVAAGQGAVGPTIDKAATTQVATFSQGTIPPNSSIDLVGLSATFGQGTITYAPDGDITIALVGQQIGLSQGTITYESDSTANQSSGAPGHFLRRFSAEINGKFYYFDSLAELQAVLNSFKTKQKKKIAKKVERAAIPVTIPHVEVPVHIPMWAAQEIEKTNKSLEAYYWQQYEQLMNQDDEEAIVALYG